MISCFFLTQVDKLLNTPHISFLKNKVCIQSTKLHTCNTFHEDRIWLDGEKDCNYSYTSADKQLATCDISWTDGLCDNCDGGGSSNGGEREWNIILNQ